MADLVENDILIKERKSLKGIIEEMEDEVLANAGVDVFEEVFKLIFTKLFDEMESGRNDSRHLEFRNYGNTSVFGFYPEENKVNPYTDKSSVSSMGNDESHGYDVSISQSVSASDLASIISYSTNYTATYNLDSYNCTDFAIEVGNIMGLGLPACNGTWPGGGGSNPGTLGQYLRNMTLPVGVSRTTSGGSAPSNKKGC